MTSVFSILILYFFFKLLINSSTSISGADAPDDIPIVLHLSILSNGISLSEWISNEFSHPDFLATSTNLTEFD